MKKGFNPLDKIDLMGNKKNSKTYLTGFTLVELLVVVAILGILASAVFLSLYSIKPKSRNAKRKADLNTVRLAIVKYSQDNDDLAPPGNSLTEPNESSFQELKNYIISADLDRLPKDPQVANPGDPGDYQYQSFKADGLTATTSNHDSARFILRAPKTEPEGNNPLSIIEVNN